VASLLAQLSEEQKELAQRKVAEFTVQGLPDVQIASVIGVPEELVAEIKLQAAYITIEARLKTEALTKTANISAAWDTAEARALEVVNKYLQVNSDPDYAIKVAGMANRAVRRSTGETVNATTAGDKAITINLQTTYIENLQNNANLEIGKEKQKEPQHVMNMMNPREAEELLFSPAEEDARAVHLLGRKPDG